MLTEPIHMGRQGGQDTGETDRGTAGRQAQVGGGREVGLTQEKGREMMQVCPHTHFCPHGNMLLGAVRVYSRSTSGDTSDYKAMLANPKRRQNVITGSAMLTSMACAIWMYRHAKKST